MNISELVKAAIAYMSSKSNPGQVTAAQLGSYSKQEQDNLFSGFLDAGSFNASKYGDNSWPRPNVLGNWRGGQRNEVYDRCTVIDEPDGSFTVIENATDGTSTGAYYSYGKEEYIDGQWKFSWNPTPVAYSPPILTKYNGTWKVKWIGSSEGNTVTWGMMTNVDTLEEKYFVCLTNGTGDSKQHICTEFTPDALINNKTRAFLVRNNVVFVNFGNPTLSVFTIPVSSILSGTVATPTRITNWTTDGVNGRITDTDIKLASMVSSTNSGDDSMMWKDSNGSFSGVQARGFTASHPTANKFRLHLSYMYRFVFPGGDILAKGVHIIDVDLSAKTAVVSANTRYKVMAVNDGIIRLKASGEQVGLGDRYNGTPWNWHGEIMVTDSGRQIIVNYPNEGLGNISSGYVGKGIGTTAWDKLDPSNFVYSQDYAKQIYRRFGSLVGGNAYLKTMFPGNATLLYSTATNPADQATPMGIWSYTKNIGAYNGYNYKTDVGALKGYYPSSDKTRVTALQGINAMTTLMTGKDKRVTNVSAALLDPVRGVLSAPSSLVLTDGKIVDGGKGVISAANANFMDAVAASQVNAERATLGAGDITTKCQLWIPPKGKRTYPPIAIIGMFNPATLVAVQLFYNVNVVMQSGDLNNGVIGSVTLGDLIYRNAHTATIGFQQQDIFSAGYVYEHCNSSDALVWSGLYVPAHYYYGVVGGNYIPRIGVSILPGENKYTASRCRYNQSSSWYHGQDPNLVVDTVGPAFINFTLTRQGGGAAFYYQKLNITDDPMSFINISISSADNANYILVSSLVSDEFKIYFTDDEDSLIDSVYYLIKSTIIDLVNIDPSPGNKKFYVYLRLVNGEVSYVISRNANENYDLYIGYVVTNDTQIIEIEIVKATKFDW